MRIIAKIKVTVASLIKKVNDVLDPGSSLS